MANSQTAVEITRRDDSLDIWVDANDNGIRDDDDVNTCTCWWCARDRPG